MDTQDEKIIIHWITRNKESIRLIREEFGISTYTTVNGHTPAILKSKDRKMFEETAQRGYFNFWPAEWVFNGATYSW